MPACDQRAENSLPLGLPNTKSSAQLSPTHYERRPENQEAYTEYSVLGILFYVSLWRQHGTYLPYLPIRVEQTLAVSYKLGTITRPTRPTKNSRKYSGVDGSMNE